ncbi:hypothetical protein [Desulfonatronospira thiodismutans]|uniref:hypothetical protein n=1 Tax=Desulfonatronospira thiodismutans TaxID=488939 RepID=UPI0001975B3B|nr:hypothetical protein [Desulfonatronospira thiodismutans]
MPWIYCWEKCIDLFFIRKQFFFLLAEPATCFEWSICTRKGSHTTTPGPSLAKEGSYTVPWIYCWEKCIDLFFIRKQFFFLLAEPATCFEWSICTRKGSHTTTPGPSLAKEGSYTVPWIYCWEKCIDLFFIRKQFFFLLAEPATCFEWSICTRKGSHTTTPGPSLAKEGSYTVPWIYFCG